MADLDTASGRGVEGETGTKRRRFASLGEHVKLVTAVISLITAILVFQGGRAVERSEADDTTTALEESNEELRAEVSALTDQRDDLQRQLDDIEDESSDAPGSSTTTLTPTSTFLAELEPVTDSGWGASRDLNLDGTIYANGLKSDRMGYCGSNGPVYERAVEYSIGRQFESFRAVAGLSEDSPPGLAVKLDVLVDEQLFETHVLNVGQPVQVDLDVTDVLRLKLVATNQFDNPGTCSYVYVALGDPVLR